MTQSSISKIRLITQQISKPRFKTVKNVVDWMGAMQAQDFNMAKWAIGIRLPGSTEKTILDAFNNGEILRTHVLRPTWHFVSQDDIYWMLKLTAPHIKASLKSRNKELGLTKEIFGSSNTIIEHALMGGKHLTREEIIRILNETITQITNPQAFYHLLLNAELDGIICSGQMKENKQTYALLSKRAPTKKDLSRDEALTLLAKKYFASHGPATLQDFAWWSGLPMIDIRKSVELIKSDVISENVDSKIYWFSRSTPLFKDTLKTSLYLLPAFDEFVISYKNRSALIYQENQKKAISSNGVFRPVIVLNGQAIGIWSKSTNKDKVFIKTNLFQLQNANIKDLLYKEAIKYGIFLNKKPEMT
jgi:hypothetical protein